MENALNIAQKVDDIFRMLLQSREDNLKNVYTFIEKEFTPEQTAKATKMLEVHAEDTKALLLVLKESNDATKELLGAIEYHNDANGCQVNGVPGEDYGPSDDTFPCTNCINMTNMWNWDSYHTPESHRRALNKMKLFWGTRSEKQLIGLRNSASARIAATKDTYKRLLIRIPQALVAEQAARERLAEKDYLILEKHNAGADREQKRRKDKIAVALERENEMKRKREKAEADMAYDEDLGCAVPEEEYFHPPRLGKMMQRAGFGDDEDLGCAVPEEEYFHPPRLGKISKNAGSATPGYAKKPATARGKVPEKWPDPKHLETLHSASSLSNLNLRSRSSPVAPPTPAPPTTPPPGPAPAPALPSIHQRKTITTKKNPPPAPNSPSKQLAAHIQSLNVRGEDAA